MQKLYDFFLTRYKQEDFVNYSQAQLTLNFILATVVFSIFYAINANIISFNISTYIMPATAIILIGLTFLLRTEITLYSISFLYLTIGFFCIVILTMYSGVIYSSILPWLSILPLAALLLINKKAAIFWMIICFIPVFAMVFLTNSVSDVKVNYNKDYELIFYALAYNGLTGIIMALAMVYQKNNDNTLTKLQEKNELISKINLELKNKKDEVLAQNKELIHQKEEISAQSEFIGTKNKEFLLAQNELNDIIEKLTITQSALLDREAENRSIIHAIYNTELIVAEFSINGIVLKMSPAALDLLQKNKDEVIGQSYGEIGKTVNVSVDNNPDFEKMWHNLLSGQHHMHESTLEVKGETKWLQENFFPILNNNGDVEKIMLISQDITQLKNQQFEIETLNADLKETIWKAENQNEMLIAQQKEIKSINAELKNSNNKIININHGLKNRVEERTNDLELQNKQLAEYAYINAHLLRAPLCSILGLVQLMEIDNSAYDNLLISHMKKSSQELHDIVNKISIAINKGPHFNRKLQ